MKIKKGDAAMIVHGLEANLGKVVYVRNDSLPKNLPSLGSSGPPKWWVQMGSSFIVDDTGEDVIGGSISEQSLRRLDIPTDLAEEVLSDGYSWFFARVFSELKAEGEDIEAIKASLVEAADNLALAEVLERPSYFVQRDFDRSTVEDDAMFCEIPSWEAFRLLNEGYREPIPFAAMAGKYWVCGMDGGVMSTSEVKFALQFGGGRKVTDGPFDTEDEASYRFDVLWESPGND